MSALSTPFAPQAPIAAIRVRHDGLITKAEIYSPGLPAGDHRLYCEPRDDMLREAYMRGRTDECAMSTPQAAIELALQEAYAEGRKDEREASGATEMLVVLRKLRRGDLHQRVRPLFDEAQQAIAKASQA